MKARLTVLSGPARGRRIATNEATITIGGDPSHTVPLPHVPTRDLFAVIVKDVGSYRITGQHSSPVSVNGIPVAAANLALQDGDLITVADGLRIRFSTVPERRERRKPMGRIVRQSWRAASHLQGGPARRGLFFLRDLCHCTAGDASRGAKLGGAAMAVALALAFGLGGLSLIQVRAADRRVVALGAQVAAGSRSRQDLEHQGARLQQLETEKADAEARLGEVSQHLRTTEERLARIERQTPDLLAAIETARRSVALLVVSYALYDTHTGAPLRFVTVDPKGIPQPDERGIYATSIAGTGPVVTASATGSGFLIDGRRLVTNRHVVQPWREDEAIQAVIVQGFEPRYTLVQAYFPRQSGPVPLQVGAVSPEADIAVMTGAMPKALPSLTIAPRERRVSTGDLIVVVSYPTGFDALLARTDQAVADRIMASAGDDPAALATALAHQDLISPLVTLGHVGDVRPDNIVYDAATTHGSSGGPVLNAKGEVVALNYAALENFAGARFGIPVAMVHRLLDQPRQRAGP